MPDWDNTPPVARDLSSPGDNTAPTAITVGAVLTDLPAIAIGAVPAPLLTMASIFSPAFVELVGGGNCLNVLDASVGDIGKILQGTVNGELKSYQVRAGNDATSLPGIVRPANFNDPDNAVVFVQL